MPNIYNLLRYESDRNSTLKYAINIIKKFIKVLQNILDVTENNREKELQSIKTIQVEVKQEKNYGGKTSKYDTWWVFLTCTFESLGAEETELDRINI